MRITSSPGKLAPKNIGQSPAAQVLKPAPGVQKREITGFVPLTHGIPVSGQVKDYVYSPKMVVQQTDDSQNASSQMEQESFRDGQEDYDGMHQREPSTQTFDSQPAQNDPNKKYDYF